MRVLIIFFVLTVISITASADLLTSFNWENASPVALRDNAGGTIAYGDATVLTFISDDNIIDFDVGVALSSTYGNDILVYNNANVGPPPVPGQLNTVYMSEDVSENNYQGKYAYAVVFDLVYTSYTTIENIPEGTYYKVAAISSDFLKDPDAPSTTQSFNPGSVQTTQQVIPEPAVASLLVVFGGGLMFAKRRFAKA